MATKKCTHGKATYKNYREPFAESQNRPQPSKKPQKMPSQKLIHSATSQSCSPNPFKETMMSLISQNHQYFQNKVKVCCSNKPNNYRLKIPFRTAETTYKREYPKRHKSTQHPSSRVCVMKKTNLPFCGSTTYQNSFLPHQVESKTGNHNKSQLKENDSPTFMETSYGREFLNWGGKNYVASMKPASNPAVSELPFQGSSVYKSDFHAKDIHPNPKIIHESSFPRFTNASMPYQSSYKGQFTPKKTQKDPSCKPKNKYHDNGLKLKGSTEYRGQFAGTKSHVDCGWKKMNVQQMQTLMMSL